MSAYPGPNRKWIVLVAAVLAQATFSATYFGLPSIASEIAAAEDLSLGEVGAILSAPLFGMLLSVAVLGAAADRFGERAVIGGGLAIAAGALLGASTADGAAALASWLVIAGLFGASAAIGGRAAAAWFPSDRRAFAVSARQSAPMLGAAAGALVLPAIAVSLSVSHTFVALAIACFAGAAIAVAFLRRPPAGPGEGQRASRPGPAAVIRNEPVLALAGAAALLQLTGVSLIAFTSILLVQESGWSVGAAGVLLAVALLVSAGARVGAGWVAQRMRSRVDVIRILALASGASVLLLALAVSGFEPAVPALAALAIVLATSGNGVSAGAVSEWVPLALVGTALGVRMTATLAANAVAPIGFGTLLGVVDWEVGLALLAVPAAASAVLLSLPVLRTPIGGGTSAVA